MDLYTSSRSLASLPQALWNLYIQYLWNWTDHPSSWISRIAYTARVLSILLMIPLVILVLLDIASYGIARTLGIIDDVKASTSDKETIHNKVQIYETPPSVHSLSRFDSDRESLVDQPDQLHDSTTDFSSTGNLPLPPLALFTPSGSHPRTYFTENSSQLSGAGVFSPAASRPPSPTTTRRTLPIEDKLTDDEGIILKKRARKMNAPQED